MLSRRCIVLQDGGLQRQVSVNNNNPMSPENMQELAGRLSQYAEDDNMNGERTSVAPCMQGLSRA